MLALGQRTAQQLDAIVLMPTWSVSGMTKRPMQPPRYRFDEFSPEASVWLRRGSENQFQQLPEASRPRKTTIQMNQRFAAARDGLMPLDVGIQSTTPTRDLGFGDFFGDQVLWPSLHF